MNEIYLETKEAMLISKSLFIKNLDKIRTGRVSLGLFESILVNCYGKSIKLNQIASVVVMNNNSVKITPWDKNNVQSINKAILNANIGITPNVDEDIIKINIPPMTKERRIELIKNSKKITETSKVNIRNIRREKNNLIKNMLRNKIISQDEEKKMQEKIQKITNQFISEVDIYFKKKEIDLMRI